MLQLAPERALEARVRALDVQLDAMRSLHQSNVQLATLRESETKLDDRTLARPPHAQTCDQLLREAWDLEARRGG